MAGMFVMIAFAGVTLLALMTMTMASSRTSENQYRSARDIRAADNALESAINLIRMDPDGRLGNADDCLAPTDFESNSRTVTVTATCEESPQVMPSEDDTNAEVPGVRLVGASGYQSPLNLPDTVRWDNDCARGDTTLGSCAPWSIGLGGPNFNAHAASALSNAQPSFVHTAALAEDDSSDQTLTFASDVLARRGSATMIDPSTGSAAVSVSGRYEQGDSGLFSAQGGGDCGISGPGHPWNVLAARILVGGDDDAASCGDGASDAAALDDREGLGDGPEGTFTAAFAPTPSCPSGNVAVLDPGRYGKAQTAALNHLLSGGCPGRTFWFRPASSTAPGSYWFDVDDSSQSAALRNSLVIDDPTVRVIFGTPTDGYSTAAAHASLFPNACDPAGTGVEIVLSHRTTVRHLSGQVAVCDRHNIVATNNAPAAIWQPADGDGGWTGVPSAATSQLPAPQRRSEWLGFTSSNVSNAPNAWRIDGQYATASFGCTIILYGVCAGEVPVRGMSFGTEDVITSPVGTGPVRSLDLVVRASAHGSGGFDLSFFRDGQGGTRIEVYKPGGASPACAVDFPALPDSRSGNSVRNTLAYDLFSPQAAAVGSQPRCRDVDFTRDELVGARVDLTYRLYKELIGISWGTTYLDFDGMELRAGWDLRPTGSQNGSGWNNGENLLATDGQHGGYSLNGCGWTGSCPTATRSVTLTGLDNASEPHVPTDGSLVRAGVIVTGETTNQNFFVGGTFIDRNGEPDISDHSNIRVTLTNLRDTPSGSCSAFWSRVPFWGQGLYLDLLDSSVAGSCSTVLTDAEQLIGATATVEVYVRRNGTVLGGATFGTRLDSVRLSTVTSGRFTRPRAPMVTTFDGEDAGFFIAGQMSMPRNDLNVRWNGSPPVDVDGDPVPLGGGNMVLSALASHVAADAEAGVICCSPTKPAERIVNLVAEVGGSNTVARARIRVNDVSGPGANLFIEEWSLT